MAEANYRLNEEARYISPFGFTGIHRPAVGFGVMKASATRRHSFSLIFSNGYGTTIRDHIYQLDTGEQYAFFEPHGYVTAQEIGKSLPEGLSMI